MTYATEGTKMTARGDRQPSLKARVEDVVCDAPVAGVPLELAAAAVGISPGELDAVLGPDRGRCTEIIERANRQAQVLVDRLSPQQERKRARE